MRRFIGKLYCWFGNHWWLWASKIEINSDGHSCVHARCLYCPKLTSYSYEKGFEEI